MAAPKVFAAACDEPMAWAGPLACAAPIARMGPKACAHPVEACHGPTCADPTAWPPLRSRRRQCRSKPSQTWPHRAKFGHSPEVGRCWQTVTRCRPKVGRFHRPLVGQDWPRCPNDASKEHAFAVATWPRGVTGVMLEPGPEIAVQIRARPLYGGGANAAVPMLRGPSQLQRRK